MPWASTNRVSSDEFDGAIEIGDQQYADGVAALCAGKTIDISNGFQILGTAAVDAEDNWWETTGGLAGERDRRLAEFSYDFRDSRGVVQIGATIADMAAWKEVTELAQACIEIGEPAKPIEMNTRSGLVAATAGEWLLVLIAATAFRLPIWDASCALQAMDPIPEDFAEDKYWPA